MKGRKHSWDWLLDHAVRSSDVERLKALGFNSALVIHVYAAHKVERKVFWLPTKDDDSGPYAHTARVAEGRAPREKKLIVFNRGVNISIMPYSVDVAVFLKLEERPAGYRSKTLDELERIIKPEQSS